MPSRLSTLTSASLRVINGLEKVFKAGGVMHGPQPRECAAQPIQVVLAEQSDCDYLVTRHPTLHSSETLENVQTLLGCR